MKKHQKAIFVAAALVISTFTFSGFGGSSAYAATPAAALQAESQMKRSSITELDNDTRVFKVDPQIEAKNVRFQNRYGFDVAGHLYLPKNFNDKKQYKAVVVSGPFGAVKEQSSGLYAQEMAKNGYVAVAFDPSMTGESSGTRRNMA